MAGIAKPDVDNLMQEAEYLVLDVLGSKGSGGTAQQCGLFDGNTPNEWNTQRIMYWYDKSNYLEIEILSEKVNIWRCGSTTWSTSNKPLTILKYDNGSYIDVTQLYSQTLTPITNLQWERTIENLPKGRYKFVGGNGYRMDTEWYIEARIKFLIKQNNQYYTIKSMYYNNGNFKPLTLEGVTLPTKNDYENFGFENIDVLTKEMTVDVETFRPYEKLNDEFEILMYVDK